LFTKCNKLLLKRPLNYGSQSPEASCSPEGTFLKVHASPKIVPDEAIL